MMHKRFPATPRVSYEQYERASCEIRKVEKASLVFSTRSWNSTAPVKLCDGERTRHGLDGAGLLPEQGKAEGH